MVILRRLSILLLLWLTSNTRAGVVPDDCTQLMLGIAPTWNSMRGELRLFERPRGGDWKIVAGPFPVLFAKNGLAWGTGISGQNEPGLRKKERDGRAPAGIFEIGVERGGEVTYHGPGQLVAYPIVRLAERELLPRPFVRALENAMIDTCAGFGVNAGRRQNYPGCWCDPDGDSPRKIGALGLRVEGGVTYHGIALNITTNLSDFDLIDPCGLPDLEVTSIAREAGWPAAEATPSTASVAKAADRFAVDFAELLEQLSPLAPLAS